MNIDKNLNKKVVLLLFDVSIKLIVENEVKTILISAYCLKISSFP